MGPEVRRKSKRHAHSDSVGDLLEHARLRTVCDFGSDLDAAIHRAGMEDDGVGLCMAESLGVELVNEEYSRRRKGWFVQALGLDAEDEDDVGIFERFFDAKDAANGNAGRADAFEFARNPHRRAT